MKGCTKTCTAALLFMKINGKVKKNAENYSVKADSAFSFKSKGKKKEHEATKTHDFEFWANNG